MTIGTDIYIAAALGAKLVGSIALVVWFLAGIIAMVIAQSVSYAATILPKTGEPIFKRLAIRFVGRWYVQKVGGST